MQVLVCLAGRPGEVIAKDELISTVWPETFVSEDVLTRSISQLRKVFGDDVREPRYIETISRRGYRLVAPVSDVTTPKKQVTPAEYSSLSEGVSSTTYQSALVPRGRRYPGGCRLCCLHFYLFSLPSIFASTPRSSHHRGLALCKS